MATAHDLSAPVLAARAPECEPRLTPDLGAGLACEAHRLDREKATTVSSACTRLANPSATAEPARVNTVHRGRPQRPRDCRPARLAFDIQCGTVHTRPEFDVTTASSAGASALSEDAAVSRSVSHDHRGSRTRGPTMPTTKSRTISYLRPRWRSAPEMTLQDALLSALAALPTASHTRLSIGDGAAEIRHRRIRSDHVCLHIAAWTDREEASIVPHATNNVQEDLATQPPGHAWDYLNGDGMLLASHDHCLLMPSGLLPKTIEGYVRRLILHATQKGATIPTGTERFNLLPIANEQVVTQIRREGVKKLHLNVGQYRETAVAGIEGRSTPPPRKRTAPVDLGEPSYQGRPPTSHRRGRQCHCEAGHQSGSAP